MGDAFMKRGASMICVSLANVSLEILRSPKVPPTLGSHSRPSQRAAFMSSPYVSKRRFLQESKFILAHAGAGADGGVNRSAAVSVEDQPQTTWPSRLPGVLASARLKRGCA